MVERVGSVVEAIGEAHEGAREASVGRGRGYRGQMRGAIHGEGRLQSDQWDLQVDTMIEKEWMSHERNIIS